MKLKTLLSLLFVTPVLLNAQLANSIQDPVIETPQYSVFISTTGSDALSGDSLNPVATFIGALNKLDSLTEGLVGDVYTEVVFFSGTYGFAASQPANRYTKDGRNINVSVRGLKGARLDGSSLTQGGGDAMISLKGHNISVKNISIDYAPANGINFGYKYNGTYIYSHDVLVENVSVKQTGGHGVIGGMGKMNSNGTGFLNFSERFLFRNCEVTESVNHNDLNASSWGSAIKFLYVKHGRVENCLVYNNAGEGIDLDYCDYIALNHNTVYDNRANIYLDKAENCLLYNNLLYFDKRQSTGILLSTEAISVLVKDYFVRNVFIYNNVILNTASPIGYWQGTVGGFQTTTFANVHISHNTIIGKPYTTSGVYNFAYEKGPFGGAPSNITFSNLSFKNNIVSVHPDSLVRPMIMSPIDPQPALSYGYNVWSQNPVRAYNVSTDTISSGLPYTCLPSALNTLVPQVGTNDAFMFSVPGIAYINTDMHDSLRVSPETNAGAFERETTIVSSILQTTKSKLGLAIYPNPVTNVIQLKNVGEEGHYQIVDMQGKVHQNGIFQGGKVYVYSLKNGLYLLRVKPRAGASLTAKFNKTSSNL